MPSLVPFLVSQEGGVTSFAVLQLTDAHLVGSMLPLSAWDIGAVVSWRFSVFHVAGGQCQGNPREILGSMALMNLHDNDQSLKCTIVEMLHLYVDLQMTILKRG